MLGIHLWRDTAFADVVLDISDSGITNRIAPRSELVVDLGEIGLC